MKARPLKTAMFLGTTDGLTGRDPKAGRGALRGSEASGRGSSNPYGDPAISGPVDRNGAYPKITTQACDETA